MKVADLVSEMRNSPVTLFYGAGVTKDCGGPSWEDLFQAVKQQFPQGKSTDFFSYMQEIIGFDNSNRAQVEDIIRRCLGEISPQDHQKYLFSIPWRAIFTTNYDHLPDIINTTIDGNRQIISISSEDDFVQQKREDRLYCFKLLGDSQYSYSKGGWMVLSSSDLFAAAERRSRFFRQFRVLATSGHIIYIGYSFEDDLVFNILNHMKTITGSFPWKGFAITPSEPRDETKRKMKSVGIDWIKGTLTDFVSEAKKTFGDKPISAPVGTGSLTIHRQNINLDRSILSNIFDKFKVVHDDLLKSGTETIVDFLSGRTDTLFPYVFRWDYPRKTEIVWINPERQRLIAKDLSYLKEKTISDDFHDNSFIALVGVAGSGKTVYGNRLAFEWYQTGNPVILVNPENSEIDFNALNDLMSEIRKSYLGRIAARGEQRAQPLRNLIIADGCGHLIEELRNLKNHLMSSTIPTDILLISRESECPIEKLISNDVDVVYRLDDTVNIEERKQLLDHFRRFSEIDETILERKLLNHDLNSSFLSLMYSSIRYSHNTIRNLLEDEYKRLSQESQRIYRTVSLIQSFGLSPMYSLVQRSEDLNPDWMNLELSKGSLSGLLTLTDYSRSIITPNRMVGEIISEIAFRTSEDRRLALERLIKSVTFGEFDEMKFLDNLLNHRVENDIGPKFSPEQKLELFKTGIEIVESRPLLIHLGRLQTTAGKYGDARSTLKRSYGAHVSGFDERIEHILDAEGRLEYAIALTYIYDRERKTEQAWEHLEKADDKFNSAQIDPVITPHPYEGLARTNLARAQLSEDKGVKLNYIMTAMHECSYVDKYLGENEIMSTVKLEIENTLSRIGFSEYDLDLISTTAGKANGYAYLAEIEMSKGNAKKALDFVMKGLRLEDTNLWLMRLQVSLLRRMAPVDHAPIRSVLENYSAISTERYDIELAFELAKQTYMDGRIGEARAMFGLLFRKARHHPRKLSPRDPEDRWFEKEGPKRFYGTIERLPTLTNYGRITTTNPPQFYDLVPVRFVDIRYLNPKVGDRVSYEIVFNMLGPEASRVRS